MHSINKANVNYKETMKLWLKEFDFTHVAHLDFKRARVSIFQAEQELKAWRLAIIKGERIQLATMGVLNHLPSSHLHVLLKGLNRTNKTLNGLGTDDWHKYESLWRGSAKVDSIYSEGIYGYILDMNTPAYNFEWLMPFNKKLLGKRQAWLFKDSTRFIDC